MQLTDTQEPIDLITTDKFAVRVNSLLQQYHVPSISIATFSTHKITARAFGLASLSPSIPATPETLYDSGSTAKSLTAACIAKLVESQDEKYAHVNWDTPVSQLLPNDFVLETEEATGAVTIEDMLSHRSGMPRHDLSYMGQSAAHPDTMQSVVRNLCNLRLSAKNRVKWQYCNMMYTVAAYLCETLTERSFEECLQRDVLDVLDMQSTYVLPSAVGKAGQSARHSKPYVWRKEEERNEELSRSEQPEALGSGLLQTTAKDLARWCQAVMNKDEKLFGEETWGELVKPRVIQEPDEDKESEFMSHSLYALGWDVKSYRGRRMIGHDGAETGYMALMAFLPGEKFGVVVLGNSSDADYVEKILAMELIDEILKVPEGERVDWEKVEREAFVEGADDYEKLRKELLGDASEQGKMTVPLDAYTGRYNNVGYHEMLVEIKEGQLYIDARDRTMGVSVKFEHMKGGSSIHPSYR